MKDQIVVIGNGHHQLTADMLAEKTGKIVVINSSLSNIPISVKPVIPFISRNVEPNNRRTRRKKLRNKK